MKTHMIQRKKPSTLSIDLTAKRNMTRFVPVKKGKSNQDIFSPQMHSSLSQENKDAVAISQTNIG